MKAFCTKATIETPKYLRRAGKSVAHSQYFHEGQAIQSFPIPLFSGCIAEKVTTILK